MKVIRLARRSRLSPAVLAFVLFVGSVIALSACSLNYSSEQRLGIAPERTITTVTANGADSGGQKGSNIVPKSRVQANKGGNVTIEVIWSVDQPRDDKLALSVAMDTHSVDLDEIDLANSSSLRNDSGVSTPPIASDIPLGGHHRKGMLVFPTVVNDKPLIDANTKYIELVIRNVADVPERVLRWELRER